MPLDANFDRAMREIEKEASRIVRQTAFEIEAEIKDSMADAKSGREYPRPQGRVHQASARDESPAIDSGVLVNSIETDTSEQFAATVGTPTEYAPLLEAPEVLDRPAFVPAAKRAARRFGRRVKGI